MKVNLKESNKSSKLNEVENPIKNTNKEQTNPRDEMLATQYQS
jgi:hypothetical protein